MNWQQEQAWIDKWNYFYDRQKEQKYQLFLDSDYSEIMEDDVLSFIQDQIYSGYSIIYEEIFFKGKKALRIDCDRNLKI